MVATGGRGPGSTPISVPSTQPPKAYSRFWKVKRAEAEGEVVQQSMRAPSAAG